MSARGSLLYIGNDTENSVDDRLTCQEGDFAPTKMAFTPPLTPGGTCTDLTKRYADDTTRWNAVVARDASADGVFVYCVRTTKIYCRPVCKARLARRTNVVFFETTQEARRAGFRACKRCKPDDGARMPDEEATRKVQEYLRQRSDGVEPESLEVMAKRVGLSKWHFHRVFKGLVGMTPQEYVQMCRMFASEQTEPLGLEKLSWEEFTSPPVSTPVSAPAISTPLSIPSGSDWSPDFWDSTVSEGSETDFASVFK